MKIVILCGGMGTRIRDASEQIPKPLLPIGNRPIVWHIMKGYATHGFKDFVLCLGYKGWLLKEFFLNYRAMNTDLRVDLSRPESVQFLDNAQVASEDWQVTLAETGEQTMTGGRVLAIRKYVENDDCFMLTYGDGVSDVNVAQLLAFHRTHGRVATVSAVRPPGRFGEMRLAGERVIEFNEKPQTTEGFINGGFFVFDAKRIWDYIEGGAKSVLEGDPLRRLASEGELAAFPHTGYWQPMDTLREFNLLNQLWDSGRAPWKIWKDGDK